MITNSDSTTTMSIMEFGEKFNYEVNGRNVYVTGFNECTRQDIKEITLPTYVDDKVCYLHQCKIALFANNTNIESICFKNLLNTSNVTNISEWFKGCNNLRKVDLSYFDFSNVKSTAKLFSGCTNLEEVVLPSYHQNTAIKNMKSTFHNCEKLVSIDLNYLGVDNVINMTNIFKGCRSFKNIYFDKWCTKN